MSRKKTTAEQCSKTSVEKILKKIPKVAIVYTDAGCPHCPPYLKVLRKEMKLKNKQQVKLVEIELGHNEMACEIAADGFKVTDTPTVLYFEHGKMKRKLLPTGNLNKDRANMRSLG